MSFTGDSPTAVCVLGPSRSGTSLTTRLLSLAGVYLGPREELLGKELRQVAGEGTSVLARAGEANPEGFWEHYRIMRLNERVLKALGGNWRDPPIMPPGWESSEKLAGEREEARALLAESFDDRALWGWKDPRNCLTLPLWQRLAPRMRYVICLRNPIDVAASLERRDGMAPEYGIRLWVAYVAAALTHTSGQPRLLVRYESYFDDPQGTTSRLARFIGRDGALDGADARGQLAEAIDQRLWRNRTPFEDVVGDDRVPDEAISLYLLGGLLSALPVAPPGGIDRDTANDLEAAVDLYAQRLWDVRREAAWPAG